MLDILGFKLNYGLDLLKEESTEKEIVLKETFSNRDDDSNFEEPRILRVKNSERSIEIIVGYF